MVPDTTDGLIDVGIPRVILLSTVWKLTKFCPYLDVVNLFTKWSCDPTDFYAKSPTGESLCGAELEKVVQVKLGLIKDMWDALSKKPYEEVFGELNAISNLIGGFNGTRNDDNTVANPDTV